MRSAVVAGHKAQFGKHASFGMDCDCITPPPPSLPPSLRTDRGEMHFAACGFTAEYNDSLNAAFPLPSIIVPTNVLPAAFLPFWPCI